MASSVAELPIIFALQPHHLFTSLCDQLPGVAGCSETRSFPDGETYLRIKTPVAGCNCIILADLSRPNNKYLPLVFLAVTLRELGASSVGLLAPYLCYMRQDTRFTEGEAVTSRIFASQVSQQFDWLITLDPHLHRYSSLDEIYSIPSQVVQGAPALAHWLQAQQKVLLVGPDAESEQWLSQIAAHSHQPFIIGEKQRLGDRKVVVSLPDLSAFREHTAIIIDDVIASGQTILTCIEALQQQGIERIKCAAVHGIFTEHSDEQLLQSGLQQLITSNSIYHPSNCVDITGLLVAAMQQCLSLLRGSDA